MSTRPIVSVDWLQSHLNDSAVCIVDASWHLPTEKRDPQAEYLQKHIPGAVFFDIDAISYPSDLPHMVPTAEVFTAAVGKLGLQKNNTVIVYDTKGLFSAARVWWTLSVFGFENVKILDGGLPAWEQAGLELESGEVNREPIVVEASLDETAVVSAADVLNASGSGAAEILDARSQGRFDGVDPEPRKGLRGGHIPGSKCLPFTTLLNDGKLKSNDELKAIFTALNLATDKPVYTSCGSGVTAAVLTLGLHCIGTSDTALYDGSWTEWGGREDLPVVKNG